LIVWPLAQLYHVLRIVDGVSDDMDHYGSLRLPRCAESILILIGLELARLADLPEDVLTEGRRMAEKLTALHAKRQGESESGKISARRNALLRVKNSSGFERQS
jgi:DNA mismatch repair protein MSH4